MMIMEQLTTHILRETPTIYDFEVVPHGGMNNKELDRMDYARMLLEYNVIQEAEEFASAEVAGLHDAMRGHPIRATGVVNALLFKE